jgi:DNA-binding NarL/FixJ family response regulator
MSTDNITESTRWRVVLVEDHPMFREHISLLINRDLGMIVCGETDNVEDAMELIKQHEPDVAIVDLTLRESNGLELLKDLKAMGSPVKTLVLSMHDEELYAERVLRAGAMGYITKKAASAEVIAAIRKVMAGEIYVSKNVTSRILQRISSKGQNADASGIESLADRELEVFQLLGQGNNTRQIAEILKLGESTVETYRSRIKEKLQLRSSTELYLRAGQWVRENT